MQSTFSEQRLPNGLRIVVESMPRVRSAALGFFVRTGARHEARHEHGVSHFLEHMCFKGTPRRTWRDINVRFDELGSIYNAFTSKEHTVYYGWVPATRFDPQLELLADMMRPAIDPAEFETERKVILEEIAMNHDSFEHHISNFLHAVVFGRHPLAHEILGEKETIAGLPRDVMLDYHRRRYAPDNMILLAAGALEPADVFAATQRYCQTWQPAGADGSSPPAPELPAAGRHKLPLGQFKQQSVVLVFPSVAHGHPAAESIEAFCSIFGGANSRCYWNVVQKGVCSQAGAVWISYADCGVLALFADGEPESCEAMLNALREQITLVCRAGVRDDEVARVKNRRRTHLALEAENPRTRFMQLADDLEVHGRPRSSDDRLAAVEAVSARSIVEYLDRCPLTDGVLLSCGPRDWP
jgi:predicted Zn-dependent peptidase